MELKAVKGRLNEIVALVEKAGDALSELYEKHDLAIAIKADNSPVTEADKMSDKLLREGLLGLFPEIPVLSEEGEIPPYEIRSKWPCFWLIDPLDGTKEFIYKNGRFCINVALICGSSPVFGMINNIGDKEVLYAFKGEKAYIKRDGRVMELSPTAYEGKRVRVVVSRFNMTEKEFEYIDHLRAGDLDVELIPMGASAKHCAIAKGEADIFPKFGRCYEWDTAAGQVIIESSGGMVINPDDYSDIQYNKREMVNTPQLAFAYRVRERIEGGGANLLIYNK